MCDAHGPLIVDEGALLIVDVSAVMAFWRLCENT